MTVLFSQVLHLDNTETRHERPTAGIRSGRRFRFAFYARRYGGHIGADRRTRTEIGIMSGNLIQPLTSLLTRAPAENLRKPEDRTAPEEPVDLCTAPTIHDDGAVMVQRQMHIANVASRLLEVPSGDPSDATAFTAAVNHKTVHTDHPFLSYLQYILYHTIP